MRITLFAATLFALATTPDALAGDITVIEAGAAPEQAVVQLRSKKDGLKVGVVRATDVDRAGNVVMIEKFYEEICTAPCTFALPAGWHELHFEYNRQEWTKKVRIEPGVQELSVRPMTPVGIAGYYATLISGGLLAPVSLPMWIGGGTRARVQESDAVVGASLGPEA